MSSTRTREIIDPGLFSKMILLTHKNPWLLEKIEELHSLHGACANDEELDLILDLIERFNYFNAQELQKASVWMLNYVESIGDPSNTVIICKNIEDSADSSIAVSYLLQPIFAKGTKLWTQKANFRLRISDCIKDAKIDNLVLVDDFSGTGNSLNKLLVWIEKECISHGVKKNVFSLFFCALISTRDRIYPRVSASVNSYRWIEKGISGYYPTADIDLKISLMKSIESRIKTLSKKYRLGYEASEALYGCDLFNIPNNNFPIFWFDQSSEPRTFTPLFRRLRKNHV